MHIKLKMQWYEQIIYFLVIVSLFFSFTNYVYISALSTLSLVLIVFVFFGKKMHISNITIILFIFMFFCFISGLVVNPAQMIDFSFYRYDGNIFITFAPLLVLSMCHIRFDVWKIVKNFVLVSSIANIIGMAMYLITRTGHEYSLFFYAHNAAGGFLAIVITCNVFLVLKRRKMTIYSIFLFLNILGLFLTNSRGSIFPLIAAIICALCYFKFKLKNIDLILTVVGIFAIFVISCYISYVRSDDVLIHYDEYVLPYSFKTSTFNQFLLGFNRSYTMVNRMYYLWPKATYLFNQSPFFGIGFGRFNDNSYYWQGIQNLFYLNTSSTFVNGSNHAHNSYLHVLCETGLFGFSLFALLLLSIRKFILKLSDNGLKYILYICLVYSCFSGFFEHRLTTPAQMIPFILLLGITISNYNYQRLSNKITIIQKEKNINYVFA